MPRYGILLLALLMPARAAALPDDPPPGARLKLVRPPEAKACLSQAELERGVERRLQRAVFEEATPKLSLQVLFERRQKQWFVRVELSDARGLLGTRELSTDAGHCSALDDSLALVVALLVDTPPEREEPPPLETRGAASLPIATAHAPPRLSEIRIPAETLAPRESPRVGVRASWLLAAGLLPDFALGLAAAVDFRFPHLPRFALLGEGFAAERATLAARAAGARIASQRLGLEVCPALWSADYAWVESCFGQRVGRIRAEGFGFDRNVGSSQIYHAVVAGLDSGLTLASWLDLSVGLRFEIPLTRDDFAVYPRGLDREVVFRAAPVAAIVHLGLGAHF